MLRAAFPVAIHADETTFEIQFGHIHRSTHQNTTWNLACDEVAAQKWVDVSQRDYGIALLNDSKYGYKVKGHVIDINLIRSVPYPGPHLVKNDEVLAGQPHAGFTDQTEHVFRYALYLHAGDHVTGGVIQAGYELNFPLRVLSSNAHNGSAPTQQSFIHITNPNVILETVKKSEADAGWIMRLYEATGGAAKVALQFSFPVEAVEETNALEEPLQALEISKQTVNLTLRPFEIKTLHIRLNEANSV